MIRKIAHWLDLNVLRVLFKAISKIYHYLYIHTIHVALILFAIACFLAFWPHPDRELPTTDIVPNINRTVISDAPIETDVMQDVNADDDDINAEVDILPASEESQPEYETISLGMFKVTAYCPCTKCCGQYANGITSTGVTAQANRTIAVDPKVIPYGTMVFIDGHPYIAEDCGGAIKSNRIDIYFDTHEEALNWGVKNLEVTIVRECE